MSSLYDFSVLSKKKIQRIALLSLAIIIAIVVLFIAITVALNLNAMSNRAKQQKTITYLCKDAAIVEYSYIMSQGIYPCPGSKGSLKELAKRFPYFSQYIKDKDGFGHDIMFACSNNGQEYFLVAPCKDGEMDYIVRLSSIDDLRGGYFQGFDSDIVVFNGMLIRWPEGGNWTPLFEWKDLEDLRIRITRRD